MDQRHHSHRGEFLRCLSEFFKRDLVSIPIVKQYPHQTVTQRSGLKAATIELDTAAYPNIEYIAGTRLSIYPLNPASHVNSIMEHLIDDVSPHANGPHTTSPPNQSHSYSRQVLINNFPRFAQLTGRDCLRLALTYLFDIMTAPSRELLHLLTENCQNKEQKKKLIAIGQSNESWEKWLCSSHRTLKSVFDEYDSCKLSAGKLLNELNVQQPRQYSISNIKSSKRFRTEIIVVQHKYSLRQIELNLRQLRDRENYEETLSPTGSPPHQPRSIIKKGAPASPISAIKSSTSQAANQRSSTPTHHSPSTPLTPPTQLAAPPAAAIPEDRRQRSPSRPAQRHGPTARGSKGSQRSIRSSVSYANSPITTHQVPRVSSFSGPLVSAYANATSSQTSTDTTATAATITAPSGAAGSKDSKGHSRRSKLSLLSVLQNQDKMLKRHHADLAPSSPSTSSQAGKFEGLCSNYLLNLNSSDQILCEFIENPRFTLKGNRERPIMMIGQDVGMIAFRAFLQQRFLEHDRAQTFYSLFQDLAPKKFGDMQLICLTGHKGRIEDLFKREIQAALAGKILSSVSYINRRHLVQLLTAATTKSQLVLTQLEQQQQQQQQHSSTTSNQQATSPRVSSHIKSSSVGKGTASQKQGPHKLELSISSKELIDLGDRIYRLLAESNGCLYTCCDPHMTQAIEILTFESIARNNRQMTRDQLMELLPKWKGSRLDGQTTSSEDMAAGFFTLENTYERARIVQEIYDSSI